MAKILTVDDAVSMRQILAHVLSLAGHEVIQARDGEEGVARATEPGVDLIITDLLMPKLDGIGLTEKLRRTPQHRHTPILLLTTEADTEMKARGRAAGATGWMLKPIQPEKLLAAVNKVLA